MARARSLLLLSFLLLAGCLTQLQPRAHDHHLWINWATDFESARARAAMEHKPILLCLVAGELNGPC